ncbi:MAG: hypothetical protein HPY59_07435 [Anaerolineae bacterium]|nr:hypothetical protein [Anaerolineae bacterium]
MARRPSRLQTVRRTPTVCVSRGERGAQRAGSPEKSVPGTSPGKARGGELLIVEDVQ